MNSKCPEKKLIISDIDGTLFNSHNDLPPTTEDAVRNLINEHNCVFTLSTGRSFIYTQPLIAYLNIEIPYAYSGGTIYDPQTESVIFEDPINCDQVAQVVQVAEKYKVSLLAHTVNNMYCQVNQSDWLNVSSREWMKGKPTQCPLRVQDIMAEVPDEIIRLDLFAEVNWLSTVYAEIKELVSDVNVVEMNRSIEITTSKIDKGYALQRIAEYLNIPIKDTIAIGDSLNDASLLNAAGFGVAMDTAPDQLKKIADAVVPSSDEGGLEKAMQMIS
jgi:Cof subfamily protein (haloacid dehalogenase superfamily)